MDKICDNCGDLFCRNTMNRTWNHGSKCINPTCWTPLYGAVPPDISKEFCACDGCKEAADKGISSYYRERNDD